MRIVIQRVKKSSVKVNGQIVGAIDQGFNILVGFTPTDNKTIIDQIVKRIINLRIFEDNAQKMNLALKDVNGEILVISQFTLYADTTTGRRPSFTKAAKASEALELYNYFVSELSRQVSVKKGIFGAEMEVEIINDGPVTIIIDSDQNKKIAKLAI
jgi:D-aminoacyl-tRNA deacylase